MTDSEKGNIQAALRQLRHRLAQVTAERDQLTVEAVQIEQNINNLEKLLFREAIAETHDKFTAIGLTEALKTVLRTHGKPMTAADAKLGLSLMGFDLQRFKNASAAVHSTLQRMAGTGHLVYNQTNKTYEIPFKTTLGYTRLTGKKK